NVTSFTTVSRQVFPTEQGVFLRPTVTLLSRCLRVVALLFPYPSQHSKLSLRPLAHAWGCSLWILNFSSFGVFVRVCAYLPFFFYVILQMFNFLVFQTHTARTSIRPGWRIDER
uniref:Uncharacterized protein n=1 Tax=Anopheles atroparvus TaxID=41427 RepID=A0AAG5DHV6_ANOAO